MTFTEDESNSYVRPKEDVEILLNSFGEQHSKKEAKPVDVEAQLKRKFNRKRKEYQEHLHKTELMGWLTHCNFVNERLNYSGLMKCALDMLPKDKAQCYPKDKTDVEYFTQITKWFKQTITIREQGMYSKFEKRPPLAKSLAIQMKYKTAMCRRDYVLMYIILLRAIGVQCRMVQSLVMDIKICPKSELMSLSKKEQKSLSDSIKKSSSNTKKSSSKSKSTNAKNSNSKSNKNSKSRSGKSSGKPKIPQLDGGDNEIPKDKKKRAIKLKGSSSFNTEESYIDVKKMDKTTPKQEPENLAPKVKVSLSSPNQNKVSLSEKLQKNAKTDRLSQLMSPRKTRSGSREVSPLVTKKDAPKVNGNSKALKNGNAKVKETKEVNTKDALKVLVSPRRLRSRSTEPVQENQQKTAKEVVKKPNLKKLAQKTPPKPIKEVKSKLCVPSPRRLKSRSRSTEDPKKDTKSKNVAKKRQSNVKDDPVESKKSKVTETARSSRKRQSTAKPEVADPKKVKQTKEKDIKDEVDSDDSSLKYFRTISGSNKKPQASTSRKSATKASPKLSTSVDRRILSSDDEADLQNASPKKVRGIDIWAEVYCEKEEKWICIDIFRNKVDCVKDIYQKATHPMIYVFAWNNDKTIKDVSARYCINLNTTIRKMRVERDYLYSILNIFNAGSKKTHRDFKEDEELNKVQFDTPMPKSIADIMMPVLKGMYGRTPSFYQHKIEIKGCDLNDLPYLRKPKSYRGQTPDKVTESKKFFSIFAKYPALHDIFQWPSNYMIHIKAMADELGWPEGIIVSKIESRVSTYRENALANKPYLYSKELEFLNPYLFDNQYVLSTNTLYDNKVYDEEPDEEPDKEPDEEPMQKKRKMNHLRLNLPTSSTGSFTNLSSAGSSNDSGTPTPLYQQFDPIYLEFQNLPTIIVEPVPNTYESVEIQNVKNFF